MLHPRNKIRYKRPDCTHPRLHHNPIWQSERPLWRRSDLSHLQLHLDYVTATALSLPFSFLSILSQLRLLAGHLQWTPGHALESPLFDDHEQYDKSRSEQVTRPPVDVVTSRRYLSTLFSNAVSRRTVPESTMFTHQLHSLHTLIIIIVVVVVVVVVIFRQKGQRSKSQGRRKISIGWRLISFKQTGITKLIRT